MIKHSRWFEKVKMSGDFWSHGKDLRGIWDMSPARYLESFRSGINVCLVSMPACSEKYRTLISDIPPQNQPSILLSIVLLSDDGNWLSREDLTRLKLLCTVVGVAHPYTRTV